MRLEDIVGLVKDGKLVANLRVYYEGTGNPQDKHQIVGLSIDGYSIGDVNSPVDRIVGVDETWYLKGGD